MASLSEKLKSGTAEKHRMVERTVVMKKLMEKTLTKDQYKLLLVRYYQMYSVMEACVQAIVSAEVDEGDSEENKRVAQGKEIVQNVYFNGDLNRVPSLELDLAFYFGDNWKAAPEVSSVSPAVQAFQERMKKLSAESPALLMSHMYVRYLGDLAGGQMLSKKLERSYELKDNVGIKFYVFDGIENPKAMMLEFKKGMDKVTETTLQDKLVDEANVAYEMNYDILKEVDELIGDE